MAKRQKKSPIETALIAALIRNVPDDADAFNKTTGQKFGPGGGTISMEENAAVLSYFADILLSFHGVKLVIECDGHEFHDRTKQQAAYDRARDRELLLAGIHTIRFTGSEIHHDADRCAVEAWWILYAIERRKSDAIVDAWSNGWQSALRRRKPRSLGL